MWDWIGAGLLLVSMLMLSRKIRFGWMANAAGCAVMTYVLWQRWAFVIFEIVCLIVAVHGWWSWKSDKTIKQSVHW